MYQPKLGKDNKDVDFLIFNTIQVILLHILISFFFLIYSDHVLAHTIIHHSTLHILHLLLISLLLDPFTHFHHLPLKIVYMMSLGQEKNGKSKLGSKKTALIVDDSIFIQTIHHRLLDNLGIENQVVANGKEAVDVHGSGKFFDLILMDMDMPIMNGIEATKKLRAMGIRSTIAGVSSRDLEQEKREFMEAGLDDYQEKPLTISKLASILRKVNGNV